MLPRGVPSAAFQKCSAPSSVPATARVASLLSATEVTLPLAPAKDRATLSSDTLHSSTWASSPPDRESLPSAESDNEDTTSLWPGKFTRASGGQFHLRTRPSPLA